MVKLNLACGDDIKPKKDGWINIDYIKHDGVDLVLDLNNNFLPWNDGEVDEIYAAHILEHLVDPYKLVVECHRVLKTGGIFHIKLPSNLYDIQHMRAVHSRNYFDSITNTKGGRGFQSGYMFDRIYVKGKIKKIGTVIYRLITFIFSLGVEEYEFKLKKV